VGERQKRTAHSLVREVQMLGVLLESKARKQRRIAGATLSVACHIAIIGAAVVSTAHGTTAPYKPEKVVTVHIAPPKPREIRRETHAAPVSNAPSLPSNVTVRHIDAPRLVPTELPPIDMTAGAAGDSVVIGGGNGVQGGTIADLYGGGQPADDNRDWDARAVLMHVLTKSAPRYPESLRSAGIDGHVLVEFMVDTAGRVDMAHVKVLESTHELFTRAVRDALGSFRFIPAQVGGHHVSALAQMPFEFHITR
jgi:protein TonB